ncbi:hypothetical protein E2C01_052791 [Portunus trituberculatus]|uniref:Secreted protein n=1 Tax=Portunus trituberculatus TaxID=210409 RepID=A0A5B7GIL5_PORTR|nr:hypothetical protein [Portunus trituberculatus]
MSRFSGIIVAFKFVSFCHGWLRDCMWHSGSLSTLPSVDSRPSSITGCRPMSLATISVGSSSGELSFSFVFLHDYLEGSAVAR